MKSTLINDGWKFYKGVGALGETLPEAVAVDLPHTWNNLDGQDGGSDYYRGRCLYKRKLNVTKREDKVYYLEFRGVNAIADVYVNGSLAVHHEGGFSTFRANVTDLLADGENDIDVFADNSPNDRVYPQRADFTFFGGIYRDAYLLEANPSRFDLDYFGGPGVSVTPKVQPDGSATVAVHAYVTLPLCGQTVKVQILFDGNAVAEGEADAASGEVTLRLDSPRLWDGVQSPALYTAHVGLVLDGQETDARDVRFGIRTFSVDKDGFVLNGRRYPLRGVSRHQDRLDKGWAITAKDHEEDMQLIAEVGANTIRLAHYQHDAHFYDLADEYGMVVWAEIPYISSHMPNGCDNAVSQMTELIVQNYNHPCIVVWGLSNEITIGGETEGTLEFHRRLNDLCHATDPTRLTTMAHVTMLEPSDPLTFVSDVMSYNHYFGWYMGSVEDNATWLDDFRKAYPDRAIGLSEYGCEGILTWHTSSPAQGDYSEEYQAYYHEKMLEIIEERPYLWATHVWNMFDFGVDGRDEGGVKGRNNKGLVTYDRRTKKDSFFVYKAHWSKEPFVHIASKRYVKRPEKKTKIKVYSNLPEITLYVNGKKFASQRGKYVFEFEVPLRLFGNTCVRAAGGAAEDSARFVRVRKPCEEYTFKKKDVGVANWFEKDGVRYEFKFPEGKFSIKDKLSQIMANPEGEALIMKIVDMAVAKLKEQGEELPFKISKSLFKLAGNMTIESIAGMFGSKVPQDMLLWVNEELNKISKNGK